MLRLEHDPHTASAQTLEHTVIAQQQSESRTAANPGSLVAGQKAMLDQL